ncbi:MAG: hypothetical protein [Cressdnaviricota sp.]|nr:MAG: hypothetical protein [Cressdnaviricota sp.]
MSMKMKASRQKQFIPGLRPFKKRKLNPVRVFKSAPSEVKTVDIPVQTNLLSTTAIFTTLNATALGTEIYNRIGRRIHLKSIQLRGQILKLNNGGVNDSDFCRIILFYDNEGTTSAIADLLTSTDATGAVTSDVFSLVNPSNFERYKVFKDTQYSMPADGSVLPSSNVITDYKGDYSFKYFIKLKDLPTNYGTGGSIAGGGLQLMTVGAQSASLADYQVRWFARVRYSDR